MSACPWPRLFLLNACGRHDRPADRNTRVDTEAVDKLCVSLVTGASGRSLQQNAPDSRGAAVPPTFGRLFEGTDLRSPGQTTPAAGVLPAATSPFPRPNVAERLAPRHKTVSFWQCRFPAGTDTDTHGDAGPINQILVRLAHARAGTLQNWDSCPSTIVDNYVDRLSPFPSLTGPATHNGATNQGVSVVGR